MDSKYERGICSWPKCQELRQRLVSEVLEPFGSLALVTGWMREFYCPKHGARAQATRETRIKREG